MQQSKDKEYRRKKTQATSLALMSRLLSLHPIFLLLILWVILLLSLMSNPFHCQFHCYLSLSHLLIKTCCPHTCLLHSRSLCVIFDYQLVPPSSSFTSLYTVSSPASNSFPIALQKGKHSCTTHHLPISQFVTTSFLSPSLSCFIYHLSSVFVPKIV